MIGTISCGAWYLIYPLTVLFFGLCALLLYRYFWTVRAVSQLVTPETMHRLLRGFSWARVYLSLVLLGLAGLLLGISLLRPQWGLHELHRSRAGRDVIIALDISNSMLCQDIKPTRLQAAQKKIETLVSLLPGDRMALILFSADAYIMCPLTSDHETFLHFVQAVDERSISRSGTNLQAPIKKAIELFQAMGQTSKVLIMFTDGEDFSQNLQTLKDELVDQHVHLFAIGAATEKGAPIPIYTDAGVKEGVIKNEKDEVIISRLHEDILKQFALLTGGLYYRFDDHSDRDIVQIMTAIKKFEKEKDAQTTVTSLRDRFYLFTGVSFVCLLMQWLL